MRLICKSRTYQLSVATNKWNADDKINYSHAIARRLPAEVLLDAVYRVTGLGVEVPRRPAGDPRGRPARLGGRAAQRLPDHLRPARPRERLRMRAVAAACSSGPSWPWSAVRRSATPSPTRQRADQAGQYRGGRPQADQRTVHADLEPAGDRRRDRDLPQGHARPSMRTTAGWPRSCSARREVEYRHEAARARAQAATRRSPRPRRRSPPSRRSWRPSSPKPKRKKAEATAKLEADLKTYESDRPRPRRSPTGRRRTPQSIVNRWQILEPKAMSATNGSKFAKEAGRLDRRLGP